VIEKVKRYFARLFVRLMTKYTDVEVRVVSLPEGDRSADEYIKKLGIKEYKDLK